MPWLETSSMEEREQFITDERRGLYTRTELCARYGISRKTGYKWLDTATTPRDGAGCGTEAMRRTTARTASTRRLRTCCARRDAGIATGGPRS